MIGMRTLESNLGFNPGLDYGTWTFFKKYCFVSQLSYLKKGDNNLWDGLEL